MKSILSKLWLGITSLVIIIILIIGLFQVTLLDKFYINQKTDTLLDEGNKIASLIVSSKDYKINSQQTIDKINFFTDSFHTQATIIDLDNNILFDSVPKKRFPNAHRNPPEGPKKFPKYYILESDILKGETFVKKNIQFDDSLYFVIVGIPIKENNHVSSYIILESPIASIKEATLILKKQLLIITFVSLVIATLLALLLAKLFTKPILEITTVSKKIAKGNFSASVKLKSKDEIRILGDTINNMAIQLEQIEKLRREFIANTSHELKTPISLIQAYSELIIDVCGEDKKAREEYLNVIIDESKRLNTMVEDILYLSEMEAGYYKPNFNNFLIVNTINNVIKKLSILASEKNISMHLNTDNMNTIICGDEDKIFTVFFNLISNAITYSYENSSVSININNTMEHIKVEISDNGKGISKEDLPYIWDRFYKVDKSRKRNNTSTGLGMAIAKNILEVHKFNYGIESELGKGTLIWIEIKK